MGACRALPSLDWLWPAILLSMFRTLASRTFLRYLEVRGTWC